MAGKIAELRGLHVPTDRDRALAEQFDRLLKRDEEGRMLPVPVRFTANLETRGIAIIEGAGGGKTTAVRRMLSRCAALNPEGDRALHLHVQVPSPATLKSLGLEILARTGFVGVSERTKVWDIWRVLRHRLASLGIVVLWIDEAQDLFLSRSSREIDDMLKMLKSLMIGEGAVIVILSGTERLTEITGYDPQVDRRFNKIVPEDLVVGGHEEKLSRLVSQYAAKADLALDWSDALSSRLIHASRGRFGRAVETIVNAIERAFADGDRRLTLEHFADAWGMQEGCPWEENVFVARDWTSLLLDARAVEFDAARSRRQLKQLERS